MIKISEIGILADDLTGACDVAGCFTQSVRPVSVYISAEVSLKIEKGLFVINTQSRLMPIEESRKILRQVGLMLAGKPIIFKKIDAALRGSVGAELEGLIDGIGVRKIIIAPAIPHLGRITRGGLQYDRGIPIDQTEYAKDLLSPVRSADILKIIKETGRVEAKVCDAESDEDMRRIVDEALNGSKVIFVGSLGLACALAERIKSVTCGKDR